MASELLLTETGDSKRRSGKLLLESDDVRPANDSCENGAVVDLLTSDGDFRGRGFYSRNGSPAVRVISESKVSVDRNFFHSRLQRAARRRQELFQGETSYRLIHADADYLPGLVVDRYGERVVVQFRHPTIERHQDILVDSLNDILDIKSIYARNDFKAREYHGLDRYKGLLSGEPVPDRVRVQTSPFELIADLKSGQKTGHYLDQRENQRAFERFVNLGRGMDCFCYSGGWGLHALHAGAENVTFVDQSEHALELLGENLRRNDWMDRANIVQDNVFDLLNDYNQADERFDFIALDPPAFASTRSQLDEARRAYTEANLRAMRMVKDDGILATSSCSAPVERETFLEFVRKSARDAHTACRVLEERNQPPDHPWLPEIPSTRYLTCLICEISLR